MASGILTPLSTNTRRYSTPVIVVPGVYAGLAAAYALEGKMDEAKTALAEARRLNPELTLKWLQTNTGANIPPLVDGLRKAGLPEE